MPGRRGRYTMGQGFAQRFTLNRHSPQARGLVAWWPTLGSRGTNVLRDMSGRRNNGFFIGGAADPVWVATDRGAVLDFDGNDKVNIDAGQTAILNGSAITVAAWVRLRSYGVVANTRQVLGDDAIGDGSIGLRVGGDGTLLNNDKLYGQVITGAARDGLMGTTSLALNQWYHVVFTWRQNGNKALYVNGRQDNVAAAGANPIDGAQASTLFLGDDDVRGRFWDGLIGDTRIHLCQFTPGEVWHQFTEPWDLYKTPMVPRARSPFLPERGVLRGAWRGIYRGM